jgi:hypothetical protein
MVHASGMELHNVQLNVEHGPAFLMEDCTEAELDHVASRRLAKGEPVVRIERSEGAIVRDSRTFAGVGSGVLVSVPAGEAKGVRTAGNVAAAGMEMVER